MKADEFVKEHYRDIEHEDALKVITKTQQENLLLRFNAEGRIDHDYIEIAKMRGGTANAVQVSISQGLKRLRAFYGVEAPVRGTTKVVFKQGGEETEPAKEQEAEKPKPSKPKGIDFGVPAEVLREERDRGIKTPDLGFAAAAIYHGFAMTEMVVNGDARKAMFIFGPQEGISDFEDLWNANKVEVKAKAFMELRDRIKHRVYDESRPGMYKNVIA